MPLQDGHFVRWLSDTCALPLPLQYGHLLDLDKPHNEKIITLAIMISTIAISHS
jgi:hypothetical protein